jgi:hypothetical protein
MVKMRAMEAKTIIEIHEMARWIRCGKFQQSEVHAKQGD